MSTASELSTASPTDKRRLPATVTVAALFGGSATQFAWIALMTALVPIWYVTQSKTVDPFELFAFLGDTVEVQGVVTGVIESDRQALGRDAAGMEWERVTFDGIRYAYVGPDGSKHRAIARGLQQHKHDGYTEVGATVPVEYAAGHPAWSRVPGLDRDGEAELWIVGGAYWIALLVVSLALVGLAGRLIFGFRTQRVIASGALGMGRLVAVDPMPVLGALGVRRMTYAVGDGDDERWVRTVASHSDDELTTDDEALVYDAGPSAAAIIPRLFPGGLVLHSDHRVSEGEGNPFVYMIAPTLCLMGYAWFLMDRLGISSPPGM